MPDFSVTPAGDPRQPVLVLQGAIDLASVDVFVQAALSCVTDEASVLTLDFAGVSFIDSTGIGGLVTVHQAAQQANVALAVRRVPESVDRLLTLTGLQSLFAPDRGHPNGRPPCPDNSA